jgi:hypothetical protein
MTALSEIREAITRKVRAQHAIAGGRLDASDLQAMRKTQLYVECGHAARQALIAEVECFPKEIDGVPVYGTTEFPGWQVVLR